MPRLAFFCEILIPQNLLLHRPLPPDAVPWARVALGSGCCRLGRGLPVNAMCRAARPGMRRRLRRRAREDAAARTWPEAEATLEPVQHLQQAGERMRFRVRG
uniref:Uncharacterized protein n=1 Tax=Arundo donax TaxID=35708 RepID=A0A0A8Y121_ARUDO